LGGAAGAASSEGPTRLSETGLFQRDMQTLEQGVEPFTPQFQLWSDGAAKRRWIKLPAGSTLDTANMDYWRFPVGTKLWKEFSLDGKRIETRLLHKVESSRWFMLAFAWNEAETEAEARPDGEDNARGTQHDIPAQTQCWACHDNVSDRVLGFSAVQLSHSNEGLTLLQLKERQLLSQPPAGNFSVPGSDTARAALGYLHANCGTCHNDKATLMAPGRFWLTTKALGSVEETPTFVTTVNQPVSNVLLPGLPEQLIAPGNADLSTVYVRMGERGNALQMPSLGTEQVDAAGRSAVKAWIESLK
jgi:hypothetical protein